MEQPGEATRISGFVCRDKPAIVEIAEDLKKNSNDISERGQELLNTGDCVNVRGLEGFVQSMYPPFTLPEGDRVRIVGISKESKTAPFADYYTVLSVEDAGFAMNEAKYIKNNRINKFWGLIR